MINIPLYYDDNLVGTLNAAPEGPHVVYEKKWLASRNAFPLSLTMPLDRQRHEAAVVDPWIANLLPEGSALSTAARRLGVATEDKLGLLSEMGRDVAGAISVGAPRRDLKGGYHTIPDEGALQKILDDLPRKPFLVGEEGVSMSLAGVQEKLPVAVVDGALAIPVNGAPSTHILKPSDPNRLYGGTHNEALCLVLAKLVGLSTAEVTTGVAGDREYLLVTRYDRLVRGSKVHQFHQEDFCQAMGIPPEAKYERNQSAIKGPTFPAMIKLVRSEMEAPNVLRLLDALIFNVSVCNTDAHGKNYSIILSGGPPQIAPLYDIMCADRWDVSQNLANSIAKKVRGDYIERRHWERFAMECGVARTRLLERIETVVTAVARHLPEARRIVEEMPAGAHPMLPEFEEAIARRCKTMLANLKRGPSEECGCGSAFNIAPPSAEGHFS